MENLGTKLLCGVVSALSDDPFLYEVLKTIKKAPMNATKREIYREVVHKAAKEYAFGDNLDFNKRCDNEILVHPEIEALLENEYNRLLASEVKCVTLTTQYEVFKNSSVHDVGKMKNLIREFIKLNEINKDPTNNSKKDKILKNNFLNVILAVDGLNGTGVSDLTSYIFNLSSGMNDGSHNAAVRKLYSFVPELITGTNCTHIVKLALLKLYRGFIMDRDVLMLIDEAIDTTHDYLFRQSVHYEEIKLLVKDNFIQMLQTEYCDSVCSVNDEAHKRIVGLRASMKKKSDGSKYHNNKKHKKQVEREEMDTTSETPEHTTLEPNTVTEAATSEDVAPGAATPPTPGAATPGAEPSTPESIYPEAIGTDYAETIGPDYTETPEPASETPETTFVPPKPVAKKIKLNKIKPPKSTPPTSELTHAALEDAPVAQRTQNAGNNHNKRKREVDTDGSKKKNSKKE